MFQPDNRRKKSKNLFQYAQFHLHSYPETKSTNFAEPLFDGNEYSNREDSKANQKKNTATKTAVERQYTKKQKPSSIRKISYDQINLLFKHFNSPLQGVSLKLKSKTKKYFSHGQPFHLFYCDVRKKTM